MQRSKPNPVDRKKKKKKTGNAGTTPPATCCVAVSGCLLSNGKKLPITLHVSGQAVKVFLKLLCCPSNRLKSRVGNVDTKKKETKMESLVQ